MPSKESRIWSDSGVEPDPGEETYSGSEKPIAEYDNWAMWALTTDVDSLFDAVGDLDGVSGVTEVTAGLNADKPDVANVSNGHLYIATDAGYADIATSDSWARIATTSYDDLSGAYDDSDARTAVEGNVDAAALTGDSGTDGQVLETDGAAAAWSDPPDARSDEEIEDVVAALLAAGDKLSWTYDDGNDTLTVNTSALNQEEVEDTVASLISTGSNLAFNYDDAGDALTIGLADDISVNSINAGTVNADALEATAELGNPTFPTLADVPTNLPEGTQVYVEDENAIYVEDGT